MIAKEQQWLLRKWLNNVLLGEAIAGPGYGPGPGHLVLVRAL